MASNITLSAGVRQNLLALQNTASLLSSTQNRLATGKKVNSALDNPTNFFTSSSLSSRASDLSNILDSMSNGINTLKAADNGITAITKAVESMQATVSQARQDASWKSSSYTIDATTIGTSTIKNLSFSGGAVGTTPVDIALNDTATATQPLLTAGAAFTPLDMTTGDEVYGFDVTVDGGAAVTISLATADNTGGGTTLTLAETIAGINSDLAAATSDVRVRDSVATPGNLEFYVASGTHTGTSSSIAVGTLTNGGTTPTATTGFGFGTGATDSGAAAGGAGTAKTVDELVTLINASTSLTGKVKASNDGGKLNIQNLSTEDLSVVGASATAVNGGTGGSNTQTVGGNAVRKNLITQFNDLRSQLDKLADDASFNGVNLLHGDTLKLVFNETNTSSISIVSQDTDGINVGVLGIGSASGTEFSSNSSLDTRSDALHDALTSLRSQASAFGSNLSIVQNRQDFTKSMINTLQTGSDALVLADGNEEAANLLALQTRQQLSTTALSLASQADQGVLRLF